MGVLGKILVFVNLVFSLLTAGLIIVVFTTRSNWKDAYDKQSKNMAIVQASAQASEGAAAEQVRAKDGEMQRLKGEKKAADDARAKTQEDLLKAQADLKALNESFVKGSTNTDALTQELSRRKTELEALQKLLGERDKKVSEIDLQMAKLRDEKVSFEIQYKAAKEKISGLMSQNETLTRENAALKAQFGNTPSTTTGGTQKTVPPEDVRGTIKRIDGDMATISVGSDAGVNVGNVLQVYRLRPQPEWLCTITVLAVTPNEAVGRLAGPKRIQVKPQDEVAATILGR
jgi:septal ring factor EnvC (AmiA/AmiB activator)